MMSKPTLFVHENLQYYMSEKAALESKAISETMTLSAVSAPVHLTTQVKECFAFILSPFGPNESSYSTHKWAKEVNLIRERYEVDTGVKTATLATFSNGRATFSSRRPYS